MNPDTCTICTVCRRPTPEPDTAFCGDACAERWVSDAAEFVNALTHGFKTDADLTLAALDVVRRATITGIWN